METFRHSPARGAQRRFRHAAGHAHHLAHTGPPGQRRHAHRHALADAGHEIRPLDAGGQLTDDLALSEHRAGRGDGRGLRALCGAGSQLAHIHPQDGRHHIQKAARTGRAFVVHHEVGHPAVLGQGDDLRVLTADINHRPKAREDEPSAHRVARQLADLAVGSLVVLAAVAR